MAIFFIKRRDHVKRIIAFILALIMAFGNIGIGFAQEATPTDLDTSMEIVEIEDDDYGYVSVDPRVFIQMDPEYVSMYDELTLIAILMDFPPEHTIYWEYSIDEQNWIVIENEHENTYTFIVTPENVNYWWRVCVKVED